MKNNNNQIKEDKLKPIIPTLRITKRFVKIKIESNKKYDFKEISNKLTEELIYYIGAIDFAKGGIWFLKDKFDYDNQELIIKVTTKFKDKLLSACALVNKMGNDTIQIKTLRVSGTLKGVQKSEEINS